MCQYASMLVCKYVIAQVCQCPSLSVPKFVSAKVHHCALYKYVSTQVCLHPTISVRKYVSTVSTQSVNHHLSISVCQYVSAQVYQYARTSVHQHVSLSACKFINMQVHQYASLFASMLVCKYISAHVSLDGPLKITYFSIIASAELSNCLEPHGKLT